MKWYKVMTHLDQSWLLVVASVNLLYRSLSPGGRSTGLRRRNRINY